MARIARPLVILLALVLTLPATFAQTSEEAAAACPAGMRFMEGVGLVCPAPGGLFEVFSPEMESLGFTHGTDPVPADEEPLTPEAGTSVACVPGTAGTYYIQVIYARATNDVDQYASLVGSIRTLTANANKFVDDAAIATGGSASLRVKCVGGLVEVKNEVLPTAMASASFSTIVTDLRAKGYNDGKVKYLVYYDDTGACSCGGTGHVYNDDSPGVTNLNNGNGVSFFAVNFGYPTSTRVWLHELGHNLGAVQNSAGRSTGALHCYDGRDIMCYNDGGPNGHLYSTSYCAVEVWDCGYNDYFNRNPAPGSYLATHWNIGNTVNRFLEFGTPTMASLSCSPSSFEVGSSTTCSFVATDDGTGVRYTVNWGDGSSTVIPSSSTYATPGVTQNSAHTYSTTGTKTVSVSVVDNDGNLGNTLTTTVTVNPLAPPTMTTLTCTPSSLETGETLSCSFRATDTSSGVRYTVSWGDGSTTYFPSSSTYTPPGVTQSSTHVYATGGSKTVSVSALDNTGMTSNTLTAAVNVITAVAPTMTVLTCSPAQVQTGQSVTCQMRATDTSTGVRYTINWGDGSSTQVPASGFTAPGATVSSVHGYATEGTKTITASAVDNTGRTSNTLSTSISVVSDNVPPVLTVSDPNGSTLYRGCGFVQNVLTGSAVWVQTACVRATATDAKSGVADVKVYVNGFLRATATSAPYVFEFPVPANIIDAEVRIVATDNVGNQATVIRTVDMLTG